MAGRGLIDRALRAGEGKKLKDFERRVDIINRFEPEMELLDDGELRVEADKLRERAGNGESLDDLLPEAFALCREAGRRTLGQRHFDVQLIGGMVLHEDRLPRIRLAGDRGQVAHPPGRTALTLLDDLAELLLPRSCLGCGQVASSWCRECLTVGFNPVLHRPDPCPPGLPTLSTAASYSGSMRSAILAAKERDRRELDRTLGLLLAAAIGLLLGSAAHAADPAAPLWLVPVPASPAAIRARGRDHLADWTRWTVRALRAQNIPARSVPALRRRPGGADSVGLDAAQRAANLDGAFRVQVIDRPPSSTRIVIVDDIVTTGATLVAASSRLRAGLDLDQNRIGAAVIAATQRSQRPGAR